MSREYYEVYETHRKSAECDKIYDRAAIATAATTQFNSKFPIDVSHSEGEQHLLQDYEVVSNEECDERSQQRASDIDDRTRLELMTSAAPSRNDYETRGKLRLSLNSATIALKSQTTKIDKSIARATDTDTAFNRAGQGDYQHVPIAFTIVPISVAQRCNAVGVPANDNGGKNLPEIVLTSFETRASAGVLSKTSATAKRAGTVTFRAATNVHPLPCAPLPINQIAPASEVVRRNYHGEYFRKYPVKPASTATALDEFDTLRDADDNSDMNSQPGSSTSPESLVDNILSAASSVSVRSSSLSSSGGGATETAQLSADGGVSGGNGGSATVNLCRGNDGGDCGGGADNDNELQSCGASKAATKETLANRSLNSLKSPELRKVSPLSPALLSLPPPPSSLPTPLAPPTPTALSETQTLQPPPSELFEANSNRSRSPSPSRSPAIRVTTAPPVPFPEELKCTICGDVYRDPRTLNCLHSFCFQCICDENFKQDTSIPFWSQPVAEETDWKASNKSSQSFRSPSPEMSVRSGASDASTSPSRQERTSFSFRRKKSLEKILIKSKPEAKCSESSSSLRMATFSEDRLRIIICQICGFATELPIGGIRQLPQNFILMRRIEDLRVKASDEVISKVWCGLCFDETSATYHCTSCTLNLCTLCKDAHERQRSTANHKINITNIMNLRRTKKQKQNAIADNAKFMLKCGMHPGFEMKSFCSTCLQIACADCLVLLHKGHKHESIAKAINVYGKVLRESVDQTRPLCNYGEHSIERLNEIARGINKKCDDIQAEVELFMNQYFEAVEVHRKTLLQQIYRARESKIEMILEQQMDLEKRNNEAMAAVRFSQELAEIASDVEILSFLNILLKRFEYCQQFKMPVDPKISDSLHFLPEIRAPSTKTQNDIPLFGIITMQTVDPALSTLQLDGFSHLRLHKRIELILLSRDADGVPLCHGGLQINVQLKYKEYSTKFLPIEISDHRDGTYSIAFTPDAQGTILLTVTINDRPIKGSPFTFLARTVRPHSGIFHCCAFCSSKGNKIVKCSCDGRMPGYHGCGHGHAGHPGRRHWSCCGNVLENSECNVANKLLNP